MAGVEDRDLVFLCHLVDSVEQGEEVGIGVDVLLAMGAEQYVLALLQTQTLVDVGGLYLCEVLVEHLGHGAAGDVGTLLGEAAVGQVATGMLGVGHVDVGDDIDDATVGLFGEALILAAVAGLHVEDGYVETLGTDDAEAGVGVAQHEDSVGTGGHHELVGGVDDVATGGTEVVAHSIHINLRLLEFEVAEEDAVEVVVVVLAGVGKKDVEVVAALVDDGSETDDLGAGADDDEEFELAVVLEMDIAIIGT